MCLKNRPLYSEKSKKYINNKLVIKQKVRTKQQQSLTAVRTVE